MKKQFENAVLIVKCLKLYTIEMFVLQNNKNKFILLVDFIYAGPNAF